MEFVDATSSRNQLLPGIPDDITLGHVVRKLPWREFHGLSSVSRRWQATIRTGTVYGARVSSGSTETLVVFSYRHSCETIALALYSPTHNVYYRLPPIPQSCRGSHFWGFRFIALDGKVYVLGGIQGNLDIAEVYVFDIAGQRLWKRCASMEEQRSKFGCGVLDGKVYVFGGNSGCDPVIVSEVYDPKVDAWSRIAPMKSRCSHQVIAVGNELCMHSGFARNADYFDKQKEHINGNYFPDSIVADSWEKYHPPSDTWRVMEAPLEGLLLHCFARFFNAQGDLHAVSQLGIHVLEV